jgi:hypothetical protein
VSKESPQFWPSAGFSGKDFGLALPVPFLTGKLMNTIDTRALLHLYFLPEVCMKIDEKKITSSAFMQNSGNTIVRRSNGHS